MAKQKKEKKKRIDFTKLKIGFQYVKESTETLLVVLFIISGLASTLILFNKVETTQPFNELVGAIIFGYTFVAFMVFIHRGVKKSINKESE